MTANFIHLTVNFWIFRIEVHVGLFTQATALYNAGLKLTEYFDPTGCRYDNYAILDESVISSSINSPQITLISQTPDYVDTLLGIRATSKIVLADNSSDIWPTEAALYVNKFRGLDAKFELEHGGDWIGSVKRCYLFFSRPGELDSNDGPKTHLELSFETGPVNKTAQFVQFRLVPPWQHELSVRGKRVLFASCRFDCISGREIYPFEIGSTTHC